MNYPNPIKTYSASLLTDEMIGSVYPTIKHAVENLKYIKHVSANLEQIYLVATSLEGIDELINNVNNLVIIFEENSTILNIVSNNIDEIIEVNSNLTAITNVNNNISNLLAVGTAAAASATAAANSATAAGTARTGAETARTGSENAAVASAASASAAATSATNANTARSNAETAATNSGNSATASAASAAAALTSKNNAETAATNAANSATSAETFKTDAETAATSAGDSAASIGSAVSDAEGYRDEAITAATTATTKAEEASDSAAAAAQSAIDAESAAGGGVVSFNGRTSAVTPASGDYSIGQITGAGSAAEAETTDFATAAQGALADTALQPADVDVSAINDAIDLKAPINNPTFTGSVLVPLPAEDDDSDKAASTAWVNALYQALVGMAPSELNTLAEIAAAIQAGEDTDDALVISIAAKLAKSSNLSDLTDAATALTNLGLTANGAALVKAANYAAMKLLLAYTFADIGSKPTTLAGYGITDGEVSPQIAAASSKTIPIGADILGFLDTEASNVLKKFTLDNMWDNFLKPKQVETLGFALSDEATAITTGTAKVTFRMPYAFKITSVKASLSVVSTSGIPTVDINEAGASILSTKLTIDANELTSSTAATAVVISDSDLAADAEITFDIDVAGTGAKGLKVYIIGYKV